MTTSERSDFDKVLSNSPRLLERLAFARLLLLKTASPVAQTVSDVPRQNTGTLAKPSRWRKLFSFSEQSARLAFGFSVLLVLFGSVALVSMWLKLRQQSAAIAAREAALEQRHQEIEKKVAEGAARNEQWANRLQNEEAQLAEQQQAIQKQMEESNRPTGTFIASLYLRPGAIRGEGGLAEATMGRHTSAIKLTLELLDSGYQHYRAVILTPELTPASKTFSLTPRRSRSGNFLVFQLPTKNLTAGDYFVRVDGIVPSGESERVNDYPFRLKLAK